MSEPEKRNKSTNSSSHHPQESASAPDETTGPMLSIGVLALVGFFAIGSGEPAQVGDASSPVHSNHKAGTEQVRAGRHASDNQQKTTDTPNLAAHGGLVAAVQDELSMDELAAAAAEKAMREIEAELDAAPSSASAAVPEDKQQPEIPGRTVGAIPSPAPVPTISTRAAAVQPNTARVLPRVAAPVAKAPAAAKPAAPVAKPAAPAAKPAAPVAKPAAPVAKPAAPAAKPAAPAAKPAAPVAKPATPVAKPAAPVAKPAAPVAKPAAPVAKPAAPAPK